MRHRLLRNRFAVAGSFVVAALTVATTLGAGPASAGVPSPPSLGTAPHWFVGKPEQIRDAGSDTLFFMMQSLSDLYMQAGLYGCQLSSATVPNYASCDPTTPTIATTDVVDNYDHIEVMTGLGKIGSGDGQKQLCGNETAPFGGGGKNGNGVPGVGNSTIDFARSSKGIDTTQPCAATEVADGMARDAVPGVDYPNIEGPGTATGAGARWNSQVVGPLPNGWLPGDPTTCDTGAAGTSSNPLNTQNGCSGVPFGYPNQGAASISPGTFGLSDVGAPSLAAKIWCPSPTVTDWAQLTNLTGSEVPGQGATIPGHPLPILVVNVNSGSGTVATWNIFTGCGENNSQESASTNICGGAQVLENNSAQFADCLNTTYPASDTTQVADQAAELDSALYFMSNGVMNSNRAAIKVTLAGGTQGAAQKMYMVGSGTGGAAFLPTTTDILNNTYPTARTLNLIYRTDTVRASAADFLNWICDSNVAYTKGTDNNTGQPYNNEVTATIQTKYGFIRQDDANASTCNLITSVADPNS